MKKIAALTLVLVMVLALCACGGGSDSKNPAVGTWKISGLYESGEDYTAYMSALGFDGLVIVLNEDGTGTMTMDGQTADIKWEDGKLINPDTNETLPITLDGDKLTIKQDTVELVFARQ